MTEPVLPWEARERHAFFVFGMHLLPKGTKGDTDEMTDRSELLRESLTALRSQLAALQPRPRRDCCAPDEVRRMLLLFMDASYAMGQLSPVDPGKMQEMHTLLREAARAVYPNNVTTTKERSGGKQHDYWY